MTTHQRPQGCDGLASDEFCVVLHNNGERMPDQRAQDIAGRFLDALEELDTVLLGSLSQDMRHKLSPEAIWQSSIGMRVAQVLVRINKEDLKNLNIRRMLGAFLMHLRYLLLRSIAKKEGLPSVAALEKLVAESQENAEDTKLSQLEGYRGPDTEELAHAIRKFTEALNRLHQDAGLTSMEFSCSYGTITLNTQIKITKNDVDRLFDKPAGPRM